MSESVHCPSTAETPGGLTAAIAAHVGLRPRAVALLDVEGMQWSFAELDARRRAWAQQIQAAGGGGRPVTAVALPAGPAYVAAVLAAATAGAAVPCGQHERAEELARAFEATAATALLTTAPVAEAHARAAQMHGARVVTVDPSAPAPAAPAERIGEPRAGDLCYALRSSGTTGAPSLVAVPHAVAATRVANLVRALALTAEDRCLVVTPLQHSTGLGTTLAALSAGGSACCAPYFDPGRIFEWLRVSQATWLALSPAMLAAVLAECRTRGVDTGGLRLRFVRSGNAPLPVDLAREAEACFGVPVLQAYGTTETGLVTCQPLPPAPRKPGSSGVSAGPLLAIFGPGGEPQAAGSEGEIAVSGPSIPPARLRSAGTAAPDGTLWLRTGDRGYVDDDRYLFVVGRSSEFVNVGGRKVAPDEVEAVLRRHPDVADLAVFGVPDERLGERVAALVVQRAATTAVALRRWLLPRLSPHKLPTSIGFVAVIPRDALGKVNRAALGEAVRSDLRAPADSGSMPADSEPHSLIDHLASVWAEVLRVPQVSPDDDFLSLGGDSLLAARVTSRLECDLALRLPLRGLIEATSLAAYAQWIEAVALNAANATAIPKRDRGGATA